jgi:Flp pilus assembly protein TadG
MRNLTPYRKLRRFLNECRSSAAVEFALTVPIIILLGLGAIEFSAAVRAQLNVNRTARYVADILQNQTSVSAAQLTDYLYAAQDMYANGGADGALSLSAASINFNNQDVNGNAQALVVCTNWDAAYAGITVPQKYTPIPNAALTNDVSLTDSLDNDSVIVVDASAVFTLPFMPAFYGKIPSIFTFTAISRVRPRYVLQIPTNPSGGFNSQCKP